MHLTTLVELLERDVGSSASTRTKLAELLAERGDRSGAATQTRVARRMAALVTLEHDGLHGPSPGSGGQGTR